MEMVYIGTLYSFPDIKTNEDRTRIIVFATDNAVDGKELISLEDASSLCKKYNVNVYAYCPTTEMNEYVTEKNIAKYKNAIEINAGGKFYTGNLSSMTYNIVNEIKETKTSLQKTSNKKYVTDQPEFIVIIVVLLFSALIVAEKIIKI